MQIGYLVSPKNKRQTNEPQALDKLISESEPLMLRKARSLVLLKLRGYAPAVILQQKQPK
jgi:hypothetical protein